MYNLKIKNDQDEIINFTDWQKETVDFLDEHKNIKKVWLINQQRKTGATYFAKLLMYFRPPCTSTFVISQNLDWSKYLAKHDRFSIEFLINPYKSKDGEYHKVSNFLTPVTLFGLEKEVNMHKICNDTASFECLYDNEFNVKQYKKLCSYDFDFFIINVSLKDLDKAYDYILEDFEKDDVLIKFIDNSLYEKWWNEQLEYKDYFERINSNINLYNILKKKYMNDKKTVDVRAKDGSFQTTYIDK